jgi:hydrogenase-4 component F
MLAYSSIEHMGLLAIGAAVGGPVALAAVLLHVLGHGLAKATAFVVAGRILAVEGSSRIDDVRGLLARRPALAVPFVTAMAALLGFPPFALFFSEVGIVVAGWQAGLGAAMGAVLALLLVLFAGLARATASMVLGGTGTDATPGVRGAGGPLVPLATALGATAVVGLLAVPVGTVIVRAVAMVAS